MCLKLKVWFLVCDINCRYWECFFRLEIGMNIYLIVYDILVGINFCKFKDNKLVNCRYGKLICDS